MIPRSLARADNGDARERGKRSERATAHVWGGGSGGGTRSEREREGYVRLIHGVRRVASDSVYIRPSRASCREFAVLAESSLAAATKREREERSVAGNATVIYTCNTTGRRESAILSDLTDILRKNVRNLLD